MDNLVDIDALLGGLELESNEIQSKQALPSSSNGGLGNGSSEHASKMLMLSDVSSGSSSLANSGNSLLSADPMSQSATNNYMDDLLDISFEPDFGPALSSLQTSHHISLDSTSPLQPARHDTAPSYGAAASPFMNVGETLPNTSMLKYSTAAALPVSARSSTSSSAMVQMSGENIMHVKPALVMTSPPHHMSNSPDIWGVNLQSTLSNTDGTTTPNVANPDILGHHVNNGGPSVVDSLNENLSQAASSVSNYSANQKVSSLTGDDSNEPTSFQSFTDYALISPHTVLAQPWLNPSLDERSNFLPLTEDLNFLTDYEQQQHSNEGHMRSSAVNTNTIDVIPTSYEGGVVANAPSLGQFSSEFSFPSYSNGDITSNHMQSPLSHPVSPKTAVPVVDQLSLENNAQSDMLRSQANNQDFPDVDNPFLGDTDVVDGDISVNFGSETIIEENDADCSVDIVDSLGHPFLIGQSNSLLTSNNVPVPNQHNISKAAANQPRMDNSGANGPALLAGDLERSAAAQPDLLDNYTSVPPPLYVSSSLSLISCADKQRLDLEPLPHLTDNYSDPSVLQHVPDILTSATSEQQRLALPYDAGVISPFQPSVGGACYNELPTSFLDERLTAELNKPPSGNDFNGFLQTPQREVPFTEYEFQQPSVPAPFAISAASYPARNADEEFNSLLASNGYAVTEPTNQTYASHDLLNGADFDLSLTNQISTSNPMPSPLTVLQKNTAITGSIDSFTKLQSMEPQQVESFTALHNMSVSQSHRNSLLEQNGILPGAEVQDIGWDIGALHSTVADDVFADLGLDEPIAVSTSVKTENLGYMNELPPGELPPEPRLTGFVEEGYEGYSEGPVLCSDGGLVSGEFSSGPTTADLQSMVVQEDPPEPEVPDSPHPTDMMGIPVDVNEEVPPPPPYQLTDPALDQPEEAPLGQAPVPHSIPTPQSQGYDTNPQANLGQESNEYLDLGATKPYWVPDSETTVCMDCSNKFTIIRRKHHCRCCGKIFCDTCCGLKSRLQYMDFKEAKVCRMCHSNIALAAEQQARLFSSQTVQTGVAGPGVPAATLREENGAVGGSETQTTVLPPTGVLKDTSTNRASGSRDANRSVIFSDGIRPGDENSHLDGSDVAPSSRVRRKAKGRQKSSLRLRETLRNTFLIPDATLPPLLCYDNDSSQYSVVDSEPDEQGLIAKLREENDDGRFAFAIHKDLNVEIRIVNMDCCTSRQCWCFASHGLNTVSQDEVVLLLECLPEENTIPRDVFYLYKMLYQQAAAGQQVTELGYTDLSAVSPFDGETGFLGSKEHIGLLFIRSTFQCLKGLCLPDPPYLFAIVIHRLEIPWARLFPVRLKLRLGAEFKYYPCPLMSVRGREPVYREINNTIMNLLADFHTYKYSLNKIEGFTVHLMDRVTTISIPKNMYPAVMKVIGASQECVIAFGASFSTQADSHIVCMQNPNGSYQSRTMNIRDQQRSVTGASFVVFSGSMKESYGLPAKCSIVEDGIMVQVTKETLDEFKAKLNNMQEFTVTCGRTEEGSEQSERVKIVWVDDYKEYNMGVVSPIDDFPMDGVMSLRVKSFNDLTRDSYTIRWTEVFFVQVDESRLTIDTMEITQFSETIANSTGSALAPFLAQLHEHGMKKIALRVTLGPEQVEYICGSLGQKLTPELMNNLDGELVPVLHSAAALVGSSLLVLELVFHVLE